jgi:peroxiredoxin Q/BCP
MAKYISATAAAMWFWGMVLCAQGAAQENEPAKPVLEEGQVIPAFEAIDDQGLAWKSSDHVGKRVVVLYFYPGDFTGGCIKQAESFRDGLARLAERGIEVVGVSGDSVETHKLFKHSHRLAHTLLADPEGKLAEALGVPVGPGGKARTRTPEGQSILDAQGKSIIVKRDVTLPRWTFVIDKDGKLLSKRTKVNPATDAAEVEKLLPGEK